MKPCPLCGNGYSAKVMYAGLPARLCGDDSCNCLFGGLSWLIIYLPFNGVFMVYKDSYWKALWKFMTGDVDASH